MSDGREERMDAWDALSSARAARAEKIAASEITWTALQDAVKGWYWFSPVLPNGWTAAVSDHSQSCAPAQTTTYSAAALCKTLHITHRDSFETLQNAKRAALLLAMMQTEIAPSLFAPGGAV